MSILKHQTDSMTAVRSCGRPRFVSRLTKYIPCWGLFQDAVDVGLPLQVLRKCDSRVQLQVVLVAPECQMLYVLSLRRLVIQLQKTGEQVHFPFIKKVNNNTPHFSRDNRRWIYILGCMEFTKGKEHTEDSLSKSPEAQSNRSDAGLCVYQCAHQCMTND